jgi:hypothetical protein
MRIVADEPRIQRNSQIAKYATFGGLAVLVGALVLNIYALTQGSSMFWLTYVMLGMLFAGLVLSNIGSYFTNRWGRRPDRALADELKGLDERYTLYSYRLGAAHVLAGPPGLVVLVPKYQTGVVTFDGRRWSNPGGRRGVFGVFNPDPLGNPVAEAAGEVERLNSYLKKHKSELNVAPQPLVIFMHPSAEVSAKAAAVPVLHAKQLKEYVRRLPKDPAFRAKDLAALTE